MLDLADRSDGELVASSIAGEQSAFAEIARRHKAPLYRLAVRIVGDEEEALDIVQDALVSAYGGLDRYDASRPLRAWLARIVINKCRDWGRRRAVRRLISLVVPIERAQQTPDLQPSAHAVAADRQEMARVTDAITRLPTRLRETLVLRTIEGLTEAEAAHVLGVSEKTIETRLYRARTRLGQLVARMEQA